MIEYLNTLSAAGLLVAYYCAAALTLSASVVAVVGLCWIEDSYKQWKRRREARLDAEVAFCVDDY